LVGNPGSKILQYIRSDQFGKPCGESQKLYEIILEFIAKLNTENENLHSENERLAKSNVQYENIISSHDREISNSVEKYSTFGGSLAQWDNGTTGLYKKEKTS